MDKTLSIWTINKNKVEESFYLSKEKTNLGLKTNIVVKYNLINVFVLSCIKSYVYYNYLHVRFKNEIILTLF